MPYKVVLIDDEPVIVRGLKKLIPWNKMNAEIIGSFNDGSKAEEFILTQKPDIAVSDICMPGKNGIDLLKMIKQHNLNTKIIFLSGYQEFSYARDAITFGAVDYILKPIDKVHLENALKKAMNLIEKEKEELQVRQKLSGYENESMSHSMDCFLDGIIQGYDMPKNSINNFATYGFREDEQYFVVLNLEIDELIRQDNLLSVQEVQLIKFAVFNIFEEIVNEKEAGVIFYKGNNIVAIIHNQDQEICNEFAINIASETIEWVNASLKKLITIGIGKLAHKMGEIPKSYADSTAALQVKYFQGANRILSLKEFNIRNYKVEDLHDIQRLISKSIIICSEKEIIMEKINYLMDIIAGISRGNRESALSYLLATFAYIRKQLVENGIILEDFFGNEEEYSNKLQSFESWEDVKKWMNDLIDLLLTSILVKIKNRDVADIAKVKVFIEKNYKENITLDTVAAIACMNAYYFSSFFKKHTGENFKDFLTRIRMEKALNILLTTDCKVYEIAEQVGFNDSRHFSDMFRKFYGSNPADYKNKRKNV